jgi:hypothetical protein
LMFVPAGRIVRVMLLRTRTVSLTIVLFACCGVALGRKNPPTILQIDFENNVQYNQDVFDVSKLATNPGVTTVAAAKNFMSNVVIADIVAVNGQPAKGVFFRERRMIFLNPAAAPGQAVADVARTFSGFETAFEILQADGTPVGSIFLSGFGGGRPPPPGAPLIQNLSNLAIVGGTGAFLGARGQGGEAAVAGGSGARQASMSEDPSNRRLNGGGKMRWVLHVIPMEVPEIVVSAGLPAVTHSSDSSLVNAFRPAAAGEILSLLVKGLGPTNPGVNPGQPFPSSPPAVVNSPVNVMVNGQSAEVISAVGSPGAVDTYEVKFQMPPGTARGIATLQVTAAWILGTTVRVPVN